MTLKKYILSYLAPIPEVSQVISGAQIRAGRALLGMTAAELAERARVSHRTLQRFEAVDGLPDAQARLLERVRVTLETLGIQFSGDPQTSPGVQLKRSAPLDPDKP